MGAKSRTKGAGFEREVVNALKGLGFKARRVWEMAQRRGHDVALAGFAVECKRYARIAVYAWWEQAKEQSTRHGGMPLVVMRQDRGETLVLMGFEEWARLAHRAGMLDPVDGAAVQSGGPASSPSPCHLLRPPATSSTPSEPMPSASASDRASP